MKSSPRKLLGFAVLFFAILVWIFWPTGNSSLNEKARSEFAGSDRAQKRKALTEDAKSRASLNVETPETVPDSSIKLLIEETLASLLISSSAQESAAILQRLRDGIRSSADEAAAVASIVAFLKSGQDAPTKLPFSVGPEGVMEATPTLRTALLDLMPSLDPTAALEVAREIMDQKKSQDEYAMAIRNVAWNDLDGDMKEELETRFQQMLNTSDWRKNPSAGFLEGLDVAVELANEKTFATMAQLNNEALTESNSTLARASLIALDRMVVNDPAILVKAFEDDPELSRLAPDERASLMSRLDITDAAQRKVFLSYLNMPSHGPEELDYFTRIFPNGNFIHGNWLITTTGPSDSIDSRFEADLKVLDEINNLSAGASPGNAAQALLQIRDRLIRVATKTEPKTK
jgi:cbb3-type cytochrome oxidase subunit 3